MLILLRRPPQILAEDGSVPWRSGVYPERYSAQNDRSKQGTGRIKTCPLFLFLLFSLLGCVHPSGQPRSSPPEFKQKVRLEVSDDYEMHQAPRSTYDVGDLQSFHSQQTLPIAVEDAFKEIFFEVEMIRPGARIEANAPDVPAVFEVRFLDLANDVSNEAETYRGEVTLAVVMKSPRDEIFWRKSFRGEGFVRVDAQFSTGLGPQDALVDAVRDAVDQMKKAILESPEVRNQLKYYPPIHQARREREVKI